MFYDISMKWAEFIIYVLLQCYITNLQYHQYCRPDIQRWPGHFQCSQIWAVVVPQWSDWCSPQLTEDTSLICSILLISCAVFVVLYNYSHYSFNSVFYWTLWMHQNYLLLFPWLSDPTSCSTTRYMCRLYVILYITLLSCTVNTIRKCFTSPLITWACDIIPVIQITA